MGPMTSHVPPVDTTQWPGEPAQHGFDIALRWITDEILSGRVRPGDRLPAERDLAARLGVGRGSVREAMRALQAQGVLTSRAGHTGGTRIAEGQGSSFGHILRLHLALQSVSYDELTETRVLLETAAVAAAARSGTPKDFARLGELCDRMAASPELADFNEGDTQFHVGIAQVAQNRLVRDLTIAVRQAVASHILDAERRLGARWQTLRISLIDEHAAILAALRDRRAELASRLAEEHIRRAHRALLR